MAKFIIIGINDSQAPKLSPQTLKLIKESWVFSGGRRHYEIVKNLLPKDAKWIEIKAPTDNVFRKYSEINTPIIIFASGDPLFSGIAGTLKKRLPQASISIIPAFNSLQTLAHKLLLTYHDIRIVTLTGRPWYEFDRALIERECKIGVLTDKIHTPQTIAQRMQEYGFTNYNMHIGECLGNEGCERVRTMSLTKATYEHFERPNCIILQSFMPSKRRMMISDDEFETLEGRPKMITKAPIRILSLHSLHLESRFVFWDIGFCTGSLSVEARLMFPHVRVIAFEKNPLCEVLIYNNSHRFSAPGIEVFMGDFVQIDTTSIAKPQAVFIGGHGGKLQDIMEKIVLCAEKGCRIVMNSVSNESKDLFICVAQKLGLTLEKPLKVVVDEYNPIEILVALI